MFNFADVRAAVAVERVPADERDIDLPQLEGDHRIGVGRGGDHSFILVGPGQPNASLLEGRQFHFDPWKELVDRRSGIVLKDVCVLRFWPRDDEFEVLDAVSAVFTGLSDLAYSSPDSLGPAIAAMRELFDSGLKSRVPRETEIGLAGELLVIAEAANPSAMVSMWHSKADGLFDFSAQGERLEVKTTTGAERVHWFSSAQLEAIPGVCTTFASMLLPIVEVGSTVASLFADLTDLTDGERARVRNVLIDTAQEPPEVLTSVTFDRDAARASMLHVAAAAVPKPAAVPGVRRMRWEAELAGDASGAATSCRFLPALGY